MDKSWISNNSVTKEKYIRGVLNFLDFAFAKPSDDGKIFCPCTKCVNYKRRSRVDVYDHIINHGFLKGYTNWIFHGEQVGSSSSLGTSQIERDFDHDMDTLLHDAFAMHTTNESDDTYINMEDGDPEAFINEHNVQQSEEGNSQDKFYQLLKEAEQSLYPGCKKFTKLSFIVHLYHLKCLNGWTDKSFSMLLELLRDVLPEENTLPKSFYDAKKIISGLGLTYEKIHVCPSDCILYWRELSNVDICPKCGLSRWKLNSDDIESKKKIPAKILRWFPLKPRLQRLFLSSKTASSMTWHEDGRTKVAGPVHYRWMYPIERFLLTLKSFVRNRAHPEGSIAEGYLAHECLIFCSRYLSGVETHFNRSSRNDDSLFVESTSLLNPRGRPLGRKCQVGFNMKKRKKVSRDSLDKMTLLQAHRYVLFNSNTVDPFQKEHTDLIRRRNRRLSPYEIDKIHSRTFPEWFRERVARLEEQGSALVTNDIRWLARGPLEIVRRYSGYIVNGVRFHTKKRERCLKTQNSGIVVSVKARSSL